MTEEKLFSLDKNTKTGKGSHFPLTYEKMITLGGNTVGVSSTRREKKTSVHS